MPSQAGDGPQGCGSDPRPIPSDPETLPRLPASTATPLAPGGTSPPASPLFQQSPSAQGHQGPLCPHLHEVGVPTDPISGHLRGWRCSSHHHGAAAHVPASWTRRARPPASWGRSARQASWGLRARPLASGRRRARARHLPRQPSAAAASRCGWGPGSVSSLPTATASPQRWDGCLQRPVRGRRGGLWRPWSGSRKPNPEPPEPPAVEFVAPTPATTAGERGQAGTPRTARDRWAGAAAPGASLGNGRRARAEGRWKAMSPAHRRQEHTDVSGAYERIRVIKSCAQGGSASSERRVPAAGARWGWGASRGTSVVLLLCEFWR